MTNLHLVIFIVFISAPNCKCQNASGTKNSMPTNNKVNSGSIPGALSIESLRSILAGLMIDRPTRRPVVNHVQRHVQRAQGYVRIDNNNRICAFEKSNFISRYGLGRKMKNEVVGVFNMLRKDVQSGNMNCLLWSEKLASKASIKAKTCTYDHRNKASVMAMVFEQEHGNSLVEVAERRWKHDQISFSYGMDCRDVGGCQYQQIVWANSKEVGCAVERCADMTYLVCLFDPPGNVRNELPYLIAEPCTQCSAPRGQTPRCNQDSLCEWYF